jgi:putative pyruvate formate lyase activating enzyme
VFFTGCTLRCEFCQNWQISRCGMGAPLSVDDLAALFLGLGQRGAENINIVTGTQFFPTILEAFARAGARGLRLRLVWNSSGYETLQTIAAVAPSTSFFLPDLRTMDEDLSRRYLRAPDYPRRATAAVLAMAEARPLSWDGDTLVGGTIVRHLVLPGSLSDTRSVLTWFREHLYGKALLSLMFQYTPIPGRGLPAPFNRMASRAEYEAAIGILAELGIDDGFYQEPIPDNGWLPDFTRPRPFSSGLSQMLWHWSDGPAAGAPAAQSVRADHGTDEPLSGENV